MTIFLWAFVPVVVMVIYFVATRFANVFGNESGELLTPAEFIRRRMAPKQHRWDQNIQTLNQGLMTSKGQTSEGRLAAIDVIVQQALAGADWLEISKGPMQRYQISVKEVEEEIARRSRR